MILVIEDDNGSTWTVCEAVDELDLSTSEGKEQLAIMVDETILQIKEQLDSLDQPGLDEELDNDLLSSLPIENEDGSVIYRRKIGYADLDEEIIEETDRLADEMDL